jgi:hypothetical protein
LEPEQLIALLRAAGLPIFGSEPYDLTLVGLRRRPGTTDAWDDLIACLYHDEAGVQRLEVWPATTDPGRPWLRQPARPQGCAVLVPGHHRGCWERGLHRDQYPALVQRAPMKFWRDGDLDDVVDYGGAIEEAIIGCNCHRASATTLVNSVGLYSAGCQVLRNSAHLRRLLELVDEQARRGLGSTVSYSLLNWTP